MLKSLSYSVEFPTTARSFQNQIEFAPGLTSVTGRNEAGKTIVLEMIGYCLFGKDALRGAASDYKSLVAELKLDVRDQAVEIYRGKSESLAVDGEVIAVGAQAINAAVPKLLGFGLDVFNIACAAQQGDLDAMTRMRPTARRQMVDRLIGIDLLEAIEKDCKQEGKTHDAIASSLILSMSRPEEPTAPANYRPSEELNALVTQLQAHQDERSRLLTVVEPVAPVAPAVVEGDVAELEAHEQNRQSVLREAAGLEGQLKAIPLPQHSREELAGALAYAEYQDEVRRRGAKPQHALADLDAWEETHRQINQLSRFHPVDCPACDHTFVPGHPEFDVDAINALEVPPLGSIEIGRERQRHALWADPLAEVPAVVVSNIQQEILAHARHDDRIVVQERLAALELPADRRGELHAVRAYLQERAIYAERAARHAQELAAYEAAQERLGQLVDRADDLGVARAALADARQYERLLGSYRVEAERYADLEARARSERDLAEGFGRGAASLKAARVKVKQELAPSLATAASTLLTAMTSGERRHIDVDEDFEISVDGQPLNTLSGSGKSVVNLALRIGLGQVLTSKVLPIFMGDEIDKDMDADRAGATHETLQSLRQYLTQIIVVTHKQIEADNTITL